MAEKTYVFDTPNSGGVDANLLAAMNGGGFGGGMNNPFWAIILLAFLRNFGWGGDGNCNGGANTAFVSSQLGQAIAGNANALSNLSTELGCSISQIQSAISAVQAAIQNAANANNMSSMQVINAINSGNAALANQLSSCCCDIKQTINGVNVGMERGFSSLAYENASQFCQTRQAMADNTANVIAKLDAIEDSRKDREIATLTAQLTAANSRAERQAELAPIYKALSDIQGKQPNTVPVPWPQLTAIPTSQLYGVGYGLNPSGSIWS